MPNGREGSWVAQLRDRDDPMKSLKSILAIVGIVVGVSGLVTGPVVAFYKGRLDTEAKFASRDMERQKQHEEIVIELTRIKQHIIYTEDGLEDLSEQIPFYFQLHEARMHPKEFVSNSSPTPVVMALPKKPSSTLTIGP